MNIINIKEKRFENSYATRGISHYRRSNTMRFNKIIVTLLLCGSSLFATTTTFTFDGNDDDLATITKTVDGITMTLSNSLPDGDFDSDGDGLAVISNGSFSNINSFNITFSENVKLISSNVGFANTNGDNEVITFSSNGSQSVENSPFTTGVRNFANPLTVPSGSSIAVSNSGNDDGDLLQILNIVVEKVDIETTSSTTTTSGTVDATQPVLVAVDEHGNIDTDYVGTITLSKTGSGTLGGTVSKTAVAGRATYTDIKYSATADKETYTLTASDGLLTDATTTSITSDVIATALSFSTQPAPLALQVGQVMDFTTDPVVQAVNADGLVDTDFTELVTLGENGNGTGTFTNNTATAVAGVASFSDVTLNHDTAETMKLTANDVDGTDSDLPLGTSSDIVVTSNSAPTNTLPSSPTITANSTNTIIAGISVSDVDDDIQTVVLTVTHGTVTLNGLLGLTFNTGDGTDDASIVFTGTVANINAALNNLRFTPTADHTGEATLNIQTNDGQGNAAADDTLTINVTDQTAPTLVSITRQTPSVEDTNADTLTFRVTFSENVNYVMPDSSFVVTGTTATTSSIDLVTPEDLSVYDVVVSGGDLATYNGEVGLNIKAGHGMKDSANNDLPTTEPTTDETYTVDNIAPDAPVINPTQGTTITGTGEPGATLMVLANSSALRTSIRAVDSSGNWTYTRNSALENGIQLSAVQADAAGNQSPYAEKVTVDSSAPNAPVINASNGTSISGTGEVGATVTVKDSDGNTIGTAVVDADGNWSFTPETAVAHNVVLVATQTDASDNSSENSENVTVDGTDSDATLTEGSIVTEPVKLPSTADTADEAVALFDFTLTDGGTGDGFTTDITQVVLHTSGTADFTKVTWKLNGDDVSNVTGTYDSTANTLTFSGLSISIANGTNETYTVSGFFSDPTGLTENETYILSIDGDDDLSVDESKTKMSGSNDAVNNGDGTKVDIVATKLRFMVLPSNVSAP